MKIFSIFILAMSFCLEAYSHGDGRSYQKDIDYIIESRSLKVVVDRDSRLRVRKECGDTAHIYNYKLEELGWEEMKLLKGVNDYGFRVTANCSIPLGLDETSQL